MKTAFLFPGQGAQVAGMGADVAEAFPAAEEVFRRANDVVGFDLRKVCFEGPAEELNTTTMSQPAIFTTSAAILEVLRSHGATSTIVPEVAAGLSLGEYTALYAAGCISFEDGLRLVQKRGQAMQAAADATDGSMVSIIGLDAEKVEQLCQEAGQGELLKPVNFNCPGQIVVSGTVAACERASQIAEKYGAMKAIKLDVAGAFHTEMMDSAAEALGQALADTDVSSPSNTTVLANVSAEYYKDANQIRDGLVKQLTGAILWQKCMERLLAEGFDRFYEIGPGRVLTGLMKRINRKMKVINVSNAKAIADLAQAQ